MADPAEEFIGACETHSLDEMKSLLDGGLSPTAPIRGLTPVQWLLEMYLRSDAFPACLRFLLSRGGKLDDPVLAPVLLDEPDAIRAAAKADPKFLAHRSTLKSTFTPLVDATLLHVAAEFGNTAAARALIDLGLDVNARAADGHTPLFHTVNSNRNRSAPIMRMLLDAGAQCDILLPELTWGRGFEWETTLFDVTPISYAQAGLYPQFQRTERDTYDNINTLLRTAGRPVPPLPNVPNKYQA